MAMAPSIRAIRPDKPLTEGARVAFVDWDQVREPYGTYRGEDVVKGFSIVDWDNPDYDNIVSTDSLTVIDEDALYQEVAR